MSQRASGATLVPKREHEHGDEHEREHEHGDEHERVLAYLDVSGDTDFGVVDYKNDCTEADAVMRCLASPGLDFDVDEERDGGWYCYSCQLHVFEFPPMSDAAWDRTYANIRDIRGLVEIDSDAANASATFDVTSTYLDIRAQPRVVDERIASPRDDA